MVEMAKAKYLTASYAEDYCRRGFAPVPIPVNKKGPLLNGWQNLRITEEEVPRYFDNGPSNIGLLVGEPSGGLTDIDMDVPEARKIAGRFLPPTLTSGRSGASHSHWWYEAPGAHTEKFRDADGKTLVELRSTGCQTVVEPSVHPDGDRYVWHSESGLEIAELSAQELDRACRELATATLIARHLPPIGGRHDYAMAVAGYLLRPGRLDRETVLKIMLAAWHAADGDSKDAVKDIKGIVRDTAEKLDAREEVVGGPTLDGIAPGVPKVLARWWNWGRDTELMVSALPTVSDEKSWPELDEEAYYGLAGDIVRTIEPHSEADPVALLMNTHTAFGNVIGRGSFLRVEADIHRPKLNVALVGQTSKGRKGTSWGHPRRLMASVDPEWADSSIVGGLSSGEGLIEKVRTIGGTDEEIERFARDIVPNVECDDEDWSDGTASDLADVGDQEDDGVQGKRVMVIEEELAQVLKVIKREGNTLSPVIRKAWDDGPLETLTRNNPLRVTDSHISIVGHISAAELVRHLNETEMANGLANRFLFVLVKRSKLLPFGGNLREEDLIPLRDRLREAVEFGKDAGEITWGESAKELWREVYGPLSEGKPGLFGAVTGRAEAQVVRLATLYAVMDLSKTIEREHLEAALALWRYAEESARYIFGDATGDPVADQIDAALKNAGTAGMTRTQIRDLFGRNKSAERIDQALALLLGDGRARMQQEDTGGRPVERWFYMR